MAFRGRRHGRDKHGGGYRGGTHCKKEEPVVDESSVIIQAFRGFQAELDTKHDLHERLVKLSRDITIESKRVIFLLHRISGESNKDSILKEASEKLKEIQTSKWRHVAAELHGKDPYQFMRAYSSGLQEYIEAISFYHFLLCGELISQDIVEKDLIFPLQVPTELHQKPKDDNKEDSSPPCKALKEMDKPDVPATDECTQKSDSGDCDASEQAPTPENPATMSVHIPPIEYMLGLADLTGELMRKSITSVGAGNLTVPFEMCTFLRTIFEAFVSYGNVSRELNRKVNTLRQSLQKVENACYTVQVRGSEIPKHMLADAFQSGNVDQGFYEETAGDD